MRARACRGGRLAPLTCVRPCPQAVRLGAASSRCSSSSVYETIRLYASGSCTALDAAAARATLHARDAARSSATIRARGCHVLDSELRTLRRAAGRLIESAVWGRARLGRCAAAGLWGVDGLSTDDLLNVHHLRKGGGRRRRCMDLRGFSVDAEHLLVDVRPPFFQRHRVRPAHQATGRGPACMRRFSSRTRWRLADPAQRLIPCYLLLLAYEWV